ncbi:MAG: signal peptide peptidase SppA [Bacteroidales bacterium]|jgi:protease-4|nr:signal peptide peptidase SppA [Bacteroidales bacterium]MCU0407475.1 signal peptide peptidase SppA [Bacteroidales bacterium]
MKSFLKYTLATITGIILTSVIFFITMLASLSAIVASGEKPVSVEKNSVLVLKAGLPIPDRGSQNPLDGLDLLNMSFTTVPGLNEILTNIEKASSDNNIKGILIENGLLPSGWATTGEIREALGKFRESGKFVIAWSDYMLTQECYYLSSVADKVYANPGSMVEFKGLSSEVMFYKKALEKLGVEVQVIRHGKFKGAVEPFILDKLSEENRAQILDYAGSIWEHVTLQIAESRRIPVERLNTLADSLTGNLAQDAFRHGLIDGLIYKDALIDTLKTLAGVPEDEDLNSVSMTKYSKVPDHSKKYSARNKISVIYASGNIVTGKGNEMNIGGNNYADVIRKERKDTSVKAIVLRVNSPGGSAVASDIIWRELQLAAAVKPVVISMGNYAASGGYYISAPGTKIYADPATISGSIGVFGLVPNAGNLLEEKLGLTTETVNTNRNSDFPSITRPMSAYEKQVMQASIEHIYSDFVGKVAEGRKMLPSSVDSIGQGRVWSGSSALRKGLVDELGGLDAAIKGAAELAAVETYSTRELPVLEDPYTRLLGQLGGEIRMKILSRELGEAARYYTLLRDIGDLSGIQARLPYFIELR